MKTGQLQDIEQPNTAKIIQPTNPQQEKLLPATEQEGDIFKQANVKQRCPLLKTIADSNIFNIIITLLTIYCLFGDDIRVVAFNKNADFTFDIISIIALICNHFINYFQQLVFSIEIILSVFVKPDYFNSFFFWLDVISTISLILDIQMISSLMGLGGGAQASNTTSLARAGRASRVGTKAGRVVRLVRLIRIVKLYKQAQDSQKKRKDVEDDYADLQESNVSKRLSEITTKRVIIIVLALLLIMPLFSAEYFLESPKSLDYLLDALKVTAETENNLDVVAFTKDQMILLHQDSDTPLALLSIPPLQAYLSTFKIADFNVVRDDELDMSFLLFDAETYLKTHKDTTDEKDKEAVATIKKMQTNNSDQLQYFAALDIRSVNQRKALFSIGKTIFVCIVLTVGAMMFSKDANDIALRPIERMIEKVKRIAKNPKKAIEEKIISNDANKYETIIIENAIIKIGTLLALGFGDAGSEIIASNMSKSGDVDPMLPGKKRCCIYGFCDIRNFTDATEVLQQEVMLFVNNIGDVVHQMCDRYQGSANKNIGDAFLLVWKLQDSKYKINKDNSVDYLDERYVQMYADCALITFMKVWAKMNREPKVLKYREDQRLQRRLANYKVKLGLGLHIGWSVEGAIGSEYKIDASYLSPSVNMASRLEGCTKQYGIPLLISGDLFKVFSPNVQKYVRQVDYVIVKGTNTPTGLFTIDMDIEKLPPSKEPNYGDLVERRYALADKKQAITDQILANNFQGEELFKKNKDLKLILRQWNMVFQGQFSEALKIYISGNWTQAKKKFEEVIKIAPNDGPSKALYYFMEEHKFVTPENWKGFRLLTE